MQSDEDFEDEQAPLVLSDHMEVDDEDKEDAKEAPKQEFWHPFDPSEEWIDAGEPLLLEWSPEKKMVLCCGERKS